jgi:UDP-N-acetylglucosamine--N-acetylmuramyl-(pentapeptide) pyrophosphoryl-undecaprenol N-acetylglucosamine transferase
MRVVLTGGITGGHLFPTLCVGEMLQTRGMEVLYCGSKHGIESRVQLSIPAHLFEMEGLRMGSRKPLSSLRTFLRVRQAALELLEQFQADLAFGTGGYAAAPILMAQKKRRKPFILLEPDALPGKTNRWLARSASMVCVNFEEAIRHFKTPRAKTIRTGLPVRAERFNNRSTPAQAREHFGLKPDVFTVLVIGGSQGAQALNDIVLNTVQYLPKGELQWLHLTGETLFESVQFTAQKLGLNGNYCSHAFLHEMGMGKAYRAADAVLARAGAGTLTEIALNGLPSICVPYPFAAADHQRYNAMALVKRDAVTMVLQEELNPARLAELLLKWRDCPKERQRIAQKAREWAIPDAAERVCNLIAD